MTASTANTANTAKLSILVAPDVKRRLQAEARAMKTTVGALVRRRLDGEPEGEERLFMEALAELGQRAKSVIAATEAARAELEREAAAWAEREAEIRRNAVSGLTEQDRATLVAALHLGPERP